MLTEEELNIDIETLQQAHARMNGAKRPMAELLAWLFAYNDQVVVNKDSALMAAFEFEGPDVDSAADARILRLVNDCARSLRESSRRPLTVWWIVHRRRVADYYTLPLPDPVSQMVEDKRREQYEASTNYVNRHYLVFTMPPEVGLNRFAARFKHQINHDGVNGFTAFIDATKAYFSDQYAFAYAGSELEEQVARFEDILRGIAVSNSDLSLKRIVGDAFGGLLRRCSSLLADDGCRASLNTAQFLDVSLASDEITPGDAFLRVDGGGQTRYAFCTGIPSHRDNWPEMVQPRALDALYSIQGEIVVSHVFRIASSSQAQKYLTSVRRYHDNRKLNLRAVMGSAANGGDTSNARPNLARAKAASHTQDLLDALSMNKVAFGWYNFTVLSLSPRFSGEDKAFESFLAGQRLATQVESVLQGAKYVPVRETMNSVSAFASTTPGMWKEASRWAFVRTDVVARQLPLRSVSRGAPINQHLSKEMGRLIPAIAPLPTKHGIAYWFTTWVGPLGHMLVVGLSRTGKTILVTLCWTLARKVPGTDVFILDKDNSNRIPVLLQNGEYIDYSAKAMTKARANPMTLLNSERHVRWLTRWVENLARVRGYEPSADDQDDIYQQLLAMRSLTGAQRRLHTLYLQIPKRTGSQLRENLAPWVGDGPLAEFFDNEDDAFDMAFASKSLDTGRLVGIELGEILNDKDVAPALLDYLFCRIDARISEKKDRGIVAPTIVSLPEVHHLLKRPGFTSMLEDWLKTLGKKLGQVWMDSQSPEDYYNSDAFPSIRDNVPTRIFTPVVQDVTPSLKQAFIDGFGFSESHLEALKSATPRCDYFISQSDGVNRMISLKMDDETVAALRSELSAMVVFEKHLRSGHPDWPARYLAEEVERSRKKHGGEEQ
ncbi:VirB4 family type IV secretion system protein (plasmid) [Robbsia andropogonis]|uniref:VirB4 family type IV secretion system protein n=1 Tax=Robbsia andropogonis TaxID=28092 RepID=UPI003D234BED